MEAFSLIKEEAIKYFLNTTGSHDWEHIERVYNLCIHIGTKEKANLDILKYAAVLHDIGRNYQDQASGKLCHAKKSAVLAKKLLEKYEVNKYIELLNTKLDVDIIKEYFNRYVYKYVLLTKQNFKDALLIK